MGDNGKAFGSVFLELGMSFAEWGPLVIPVCSSSTSAGVSGTDCAFFKDTVELGAWDGQSEFSEHRHNIDKMNPPR